MIHVTDWSADEFMNFADMNRIEDNMNTLATNIRAIQYPVPALTVKTNRTMSNIDYLSDINRIEANLNTIKTAFMTPIGYLGSKTWTKSMNFDYTDANRLEWNTKSLSEMVDSVVKSYRYCGQTISGGSGLY